MPRQLGRASEQDDAAMDETSLTAVPDKARGHVGSALNAFVLRCQAINLYTVDAFHLLCATVATPLTYKRRPEAY
ncbi:hypothetical protein DVA78_19825 [Acinetobacter baumannii]|nr:hypothetical protein DVA78_19825 [Acinetobacter baumannii]